MNKTLIVILALIGITLVSLASLEVINLNLFNGGNDMEEPKQPEFQGPVPEGYDLEHFRRTGKTIPLEVEQ